MLRLSADANLKPLIPVMFVLTVLFARQTNVTEHRHVHQSQSFCNRRSEYAFGDSLLPQFVWIPATNDRLSL